jgi:hypothetical protein
VSSSRVIGSFLDFEEALDQWVWLGKPNFIPSAREITVTFKHGLSRIIEARHSVMPPSD